MNLGLDIEGTEVICVVPCKQIKERTLNRLRCEPEIQLQLPQTHSNREV